MRITRSSAALLLTGALVTGGLALAVPAAAAPALPAATMTPGTMTSGTALVSPNGAFRAQFAAGRLVVRTRAGKPIWATSRRPTGATSVVLDRRGNLRLIGGKHTY